MSTNPTKTEQDNSVAPSPKISRRWFRYSLRTFLILVTIFCIWLGVISERAKKQRIAIEKLREHARIEVYYDYQILEYDPPHGQLKGKHDTRVKLPDWISDMIGEDFRRTVWVLAVHLESPDATSLAVEDLTELRDTRMPSCDIDDERMKSLENMRHLRRVHLHRNPLDGAGLKYLADKQDIVELVLSETNLCDESIKHITQLKKLQELYISNTKITDLAVAQLTQLENLEKLFIHSNNITDESLKSFATMKSLKHLNVTHNTKLTWENVQKLIKQLPNCRIE